MKPPPADWAELPEFEEPHRRGEVLVAIAFDAARRDLVEAAAAAVLAPNAGRRDGRGVTVDRARAAEEGARAASQLLTMLIRGLDYLPPVEFDFGDLLNAVVLADAEVVPDDDLELPRACSSSASRRAGIKRPAEPGHRRARRRSARRTTWGSTSPALRNDRDEVFRFLWQNAPRLEVCTDYYTVIESVLPTPADRPGRPHRARVGGHLRADGST